jgi:hypothetical protein
VVSTTARRKRSDRGVNPSRQSRVAERVDVRVSFFAANEARLAGTRAAVLVNIGVIEPLADLRVGRFRIRTFDDVTEAAEWLHPNGVERGIR